MGKVETGGLFSGSLEVVIRTDGRHWNPLMAARLVPRSSSDHVSLRNVVSMVAMSRFHDEPTVNRQSTLLLTKFSLFSSPMYLFFAPAHSSLSLFNLRVHFQSRIYQLHLCDTSSS